MDSAGGPLSGVTVRVDRRGIPAVQSQHPEGKYRIELPPGPPVGKLTYSRSDLDAAVIESLAGMRSHAISVVMYRRGEPRSVAATIDTLTAYEQLALALLLTDAMARTRLPAEYQASEWLSGLQRLPVPKVSNAAVEAWLGERKAKLLAILSSALK